MYKEYDIDENDYIMWCLLNQFISNDEKINKIKNNLLKDLESKLYPKFDNDKDIIDTKLVIRFYFK